MSKFLVSLVMPNLHSEKHARIVANRPERFRRAPLSFLISASVLVSAMLYSVQRPAAAQSTSEWTTNFPFWQNIASWSPLGVPGPMDTAQFDINANDTVTWNAATGNRSAGQLQVLAGDYTFNNVTASPFQLSLNAGNTSFNSVGPDTMLTINGLHIDAMDGEVRIDQATLNIGTGSGGIPGSVTSSTFLRNNGTLNILNGSTVSNSIGSIASNIVSGNVTGVTTISGVGSQWNNSELLIIGETGSGTLNMENGGVASAVSESFLGRQAGSSGTATVSGVGSQWNCLSNIFVGFLGNGTLQIEDGGFVSSSNAIIASGSDSNSSATVSDSDSQWTMSGNLLVGASGDGTLLIENGGAVSCASSFIGSEAGSFGEATVTGAGSQWTGTHHFNVGNAGSGSLDVLNGGTLDQGLTITVGNEPSSTGTVAASGIGTLIASLELTVGNEGDGSLIVENDATVQCVQTTIGSAKGSTGLVTVGIDGWLQNTGDVIVGDQGNGMLRIEPASQAIVGGELIIALNSQVEMFSGCLQVDGGIDNNGTLRLVANPIVAANIINAASVQTIGGSDAVLAGDLLHLGTSIQTATNSRFRISGAAGGNGPYTGAGLVQFDGRFEPGILGPGQISFAGNVALAFDAALQIQLASTSTNLFDRLLIEGSLTIDPQRSLEVSLVNGFAIAPGMQFVIAEVGTTLTGQFAGLSGGGLIGNFGGTDLFITYAGGDGNDIVLYTIGLLGDVNGDGVVSLLDVAPFVNALTSGPFDPEADINRDGVVDLLDVSPFVALLTG